VQQCVVARVLQLPLAVLVDLDFWLAASTSSAGGGYKPCCTAAAAAPSLHSAKVVYVWVHPQLNPAAAYAPLLGTFEAADKALGPMVLRASAAPAALSTRAMFSPVGSQRPGCACMQGGVLHRCPAVRRFQGIGNCLVRFLLATSMCPVPCTTRFAWDGCKPCFIACCFTCGASGQCYGT
jgi:hypothetical protein